MSADINQTLREAGDGLGFFLDSITDPYVVLIIGIGIAVGVVSIFKGISGALSQRL